MLGVFLGGLDGGFLVTRQADAWHEAARHAQEGLVPVEDEGRVVVVRLEQRPELLEPCRHLLWQNNAFLRAREFSAMGEPKRACKMAKRGGGRTGETSHGRTKQCDGSVRFTTAAAHCGENSN